MRNWLYNFTELCPRTVSISGPFNPYICTLHERKRKCVFPTRDEQKYYILRIYLDVEIASASWPEDSLGCRDKKLISWLSKSMLEFSWNIVYVY